jgi:probable selenium-dependent hydroxylase accessory protein YqeC
VRLDLSTSLAAALAVAGGNLVSIVGAGGKTSLMYGLGREMAASGHAVLLTTTTKLAYPATTEIAQVVLGEEGDALADELERRLAEQRLVLAGRARLDSKIVGFSPDFLERLRARDRTLTIVAECDGAKGKSLKVPNDREPPLAPSTDLLVVLVGADCLGRPLCSDEVFNPEMVAAVAGVGLDRVVDKHVVVKAVLSGESYLGRKPEASRFCVFINKVDIDGVGGTGPAADRGRAALAFEVGMALKSDAAVERVIYGSLQRGGSKEFLVLS